MIDLLTDGYLTGLQATWWTIAALAGTLTVLAPLTIGTWLLQRSARDLTTTRPAWRLRTLPARRRARHHNYQPLP